MESSSESQAPREMSDAEIRLRYRLHVMAAKLTTVDDELILLEEGMDGISHSVAAFRTRYLAKHGEIV